MLISQAYADCSSRYALGEMLACGIVVVVLAVYDVMETSVLFAYVRLR